MSNIFRFKNFEIDQKNCAHKVGTDAMLLGAFLQANHNAKHALEIGTGTGVIALMLQLDPTLTNQEIKEILQETAREDSFTGPVPNITFGYGKLDALAALKKVSESLSTKEYMSNSLIKIFPNPVKDILTINIKVPIESIDIISMDGKRIMHINQPDNNLNLSDLQSGMYLLKVHTNNSTENLKIIKSN